ncbi:hypothetical protein QL996_09685 [Planococcus sp. APC 4015]|nr:hypothetical protein [Planococcus sp. APC 4015]
MFADLLLTSAPTGHHGPDGAPLTGIRGEIHLTIPVTTAAGIDDDPALLTGYGPIDSRLARELLAATPTWNRVLLDLPTGLPVAVDRYRPSAALRRFIEHRDQHCRFPGCRVKPWRCDADHTIDSAHGGPTNPGNLATLCRRHHTLKHASPWHVTQQRGGRLEWTSPAGRTHTDHPPGTLQFVPATDVQQRRARLREPWTLPPASDLPAHERPPF